MGMKGEDSVEYKQGDRVRRSYGHNCLMSVPPYLEVTRLVYRGRRLFNYAESARFLKF